MELYLIFQLTFTILIARYFYLRGYNKGFSETLDATMRINGN
jgi:hypothetical protein